MKTIEELNKCFQEIDNLSLKFARLGKEDKGQKLKLLARMKKLIEQILECANGKHPLFEPFLKKQNSTDYWLNWYNKKCVELEASSIKAYPQYKLVYSAQDDTHYERLSNQISSAMKARALEMQPYNFSCSYDVKNRKLTFSGDIVSAESFLTKLGYPDEQDKKCIDRVCEGSLDKPTKSPDADSKASATTVISTTVSELKKFIL